MPTAFHFGCGPVHLGTATMMAVLLLLGAPRAGLGQTGDQPNPPSQSRDIVLDVVAAGVLGATAFWGSQLTADACGWCVDATNGVNSFDRSVRDALLIDGTGARTANTVSHVAVAATWVVPTALLLSSDCCADAHTRHEALRTLLWTMTVNTVATSTLKRTVARERPFVQFGNTSAHQSSDRFSSFPSGHASGAFALLFATSDVCRRTDCGRQKQIWLFGLPLASVTALTRIAADQHYATDVLFGVGAGAAIGWVTPRLYDAVVGNRRLAHIRPAVGLGFAGAYASWDW